MKNLRTMRGNPRKSLKTISVMLKSGILFLLFFFQLHANAYSQQAKLSLKLENVSLQKVFTEIEKISDFSFVYNVEDLKNTAKVSVDFTDAGIEEILAACFKNTDIQYNISDKHIIINKKQAVAEAIEIKGIVADKDGLPLPGATVLIKGTFKGTTTDTDGNYSIKAPEGAVLVFSFIGFEKQEITVSVEKTEMNVVMEEEASELGEVVVTGIFNRKAATYTGSAITFTANELQMASNKNLISSLRNLDPSFNIIESNTFGSDPNRLPEIQIRGNSSLPNVDELQDQTRVGLNTPLIILDGFESTLQKLLDMNENEVESITILKDASATAIYGSRGANGVVVIKTKAPVPGKLRLTYRGDVNIEVPDLSSYSLLDAKDKLDLEWKAGLYNVSNIGREYDIPLKRYYYWIVNQVNQGVNTDWLALPLRKGIGQRHNLRIEGGDQTFRYSASVYYNNIQGVMKKSYRNTFNGTINLMYVYKHLKFKNQLIIGLGRAQASTYGNFNDYVKMNPYWNPYDSNGTVLKIMGDPGNYDYQYRWNTLPTNPLYNATLNGFDKTNNSSIVNNFSIEWGITKDLLLRGRLGLTKTIDQSDKFRPADNTAFANYPIEDVFRKGDYTYGVSNGFSYDGSINLSYSKIFAQKHSVFAGLDYNIRQHKISTYGFVAEGFTNSNFDFPSMALQYAQGGKPSGSESFTRAMSITANVNYTYDNRFYMDLSFREDGSSQFGVNKRFAPFWSTGIGWNLHEEDFIKNITVIDRLKIRGSMGITGSQNFKAYQALATYQYYTNDRYYSWMGAYLLGLGNKDLRWQQKMNYDFGVEAQMFNQSLSLGFDYYIGTTKDLVSSINLPPSNGFPSYVENIGKIRNHGFEFKTTVFLYRNNKRKIAWSVTATVFRNINKIISLSQAMKDAVATISASGGSNPNILYKEGYSTNTIWVVPSLGIDPSTGKELFLDRNGNPTYTWSYLDLQPSGVTDPKYQGNFSTMFRYKKFIANLTFGFRYGGQLYNSTLIDKVENADYQYNVDSRVYEDRWQKPGDIVGFKSLLVTTPTQMTSRFVQDEKTLNCQNINLQYELKSESLKKNMGIETLSFSASMDNLFYISTVKRERGITYPFSRNISFSVTATF